MYRRSRARLHGPLVHRIGHTPLHVGSQILPLLPSNHIYHNPARLRLLLDRDGYLYFKNMIPRDLIDKAFLSIGDQLLANGWVTPQDRLEDETTNGFTIGCPFPRQCQPLGKNPLPNPTQGFSITKPISEAISGISVANVIRQVLGGQCQPLPQSTLELSHPEEVHSFHMDHPFRSKGTPLIITAWTPLQPVTLSLGGLVVARGSNSSEQFKRIRHTYGNYDVEDGDIAGDGGYSMDPLEIIRRSQMTMDQVREEDKKHPLAYGQGGGDAAPAATNTNAATAQTLKELKPGLDDEDEDDEDARLVASTPLLTTSFEPGDIVLLTSYTMHTFLVNQTNQWRISAETNWMMVGDDMGPDPRFATANSPGLSNWHSNREDKKRYPRSMDQAKTTWGISS